jgi:signal transduction histidine kinase
MHRSASPNTLISVDAPEHAPTATRISERSWFALDVVLAVVLFLATRRTIGRHNSDPNGASWDAVRYVAAALACGALSFRRSHPAVVLAVVAAGVAALLALGEHGAGLSAVAFAIYSTAAHSSRRLSPAVVGGILAALLLSAVVAPNGVSWPAIIVGPGTVLLGWLAGENVRSQRAYTRDAAERAAERERTHDAQLREAATRERVVIARELHDVVAHSMSLIAVRAGAARLVIDSDTEEVREALAIIETTSRQSLREMRRLVGVLREPDGPDPQLEPAPGLRDISELIGRVEQTGTPVELHVEGTQRSLPPGVDLSAYRIVQEALTNIVRHAGRANARLWLRYEPNELEIEVIDDGANAPGNAAPGTGHGLIGMRERVALYGGHFAAGPTGHGFRVCARLRTDEEPA